MSVLAAMVGVGAAGAAPGAFYGTSTALGLVFVPAIAWIAVLAAIALGVPRNTQQIMARYDVALPSLPSPEPPPREAWRWRPSVRWALAMAVVAGIGLVFVAGPSPFLYYRF
jgi:hypothetical protein